MTPGKIAMKEIVKNKIEVCGSMNRYQSDKAVAVNAQPFYINSIEIIKYNGGLYI